MDEPLLSPLLLWLVCVVYPYYIWLEDCFVMFTLLCLLDFACVHVFGLSVSLSLSFSLSLSLSLCLSVSLSLSLLFTSFSHDIFYFAWLSDLFLAELLRIMLQLDFIVIRKYETVCTIGMFWYCWDKRRISIYPDYHYTQCKFRRISTDHNIQIISDK